MFPESHWRKIWSNNPLERLNKEIKRRTNVIGIFPNDRAAIRLIGAVLADRHEEWAIARRYMSNNSMADLAAMCDTTNQPQLEGEPHRASHSEPHHSAGRCLVDCQKLTNMAAAAMPVVAMTNFHQIEISNSW